MTEILPSDIRRDLQKACTLHKRATSDYAKCEEFCKLMSNLLTRLEEAHFFNTADKVMGMLLDCNPKIGAHCEKATHVGNLIEKLTKQQLQVCEYAEKPINPDS